VEDENQVVTLRRAWADVKGGFAGVGEDFGLRAGGAIVAWLGAGMVVVFLVSAMENRISGVRWRDFGVWKAGKRGGRWR
jgi:hypothetical protein